MTVTVDNVAPVAEAGDDQAADEGTAVTFTGTVTDAGALDTHTAAWDFGDGNTANTLNATNTYADNGEYTATLTVTDDDGDTGTDTLTVTVSNVAPTVDAGADQTVETTLNVNGTYTDPGTGDTHTAT
jgi:PKD repeat protein